MAGSSDPRSWLDKLVAASLGFLVAAIAVYAAVHLIEAIWSTLLIILGGALLLLLLVAAWRARSRGW